MIKLSFFKISVFMFLKSLFLKPYGNSTLKFYTFSVFKIKKYILIEQNELYSKKCIFFDFILFI